MATKRSRPYDDPPSPESSEEEEVDDEEIDEEEEEVQQTPIQTPPPKSKKSQSDENSDGDDEEEGVEEDEEEEEEEESDTELKKNPIIKVSKPEPVPEPESGSDSESESEPEANYIAKPVVKEIHPSKTKKAAKTAEVAEEKVSKPAKKKQKVSASGGGGSGGGGEEEEDSGEKKSASNRVWNFDDEITILQGMIEYKKGNGKDPSSSSDEFYNLVKPKFSNSKFTKSQVFDKIKRLKKKYGNYLDKLKNGVPLDFMNPHESKLYKLSCKFWGSNSDNDDSVGGGGSNSVNVGKSNGNGNSNAMVITSPAKVNVIGLPVPVNENVVNNGKSGGVKSSKKSKKLDKFDVDEEKKPLKKVKSSSSDAMEVDKEKKKPKVEKTVVVKMVENGFDGELSPNLAKEEEKTVLKAEEEEEDEEEDFDEELYPYLTMAMEGELTVPEIQVSDQLSGSLSMVDSELLEIWDAKWKDIHIAEMEAHARRLDLIREQTSWFIKYMKSKP